MDEGHHGEEPALDVLVAAGSHVQRMQGFKARRIDDGHLQGQQGVSQGASTTMLASGSCRLPQSPSVLVATPQRVPRD